MMTDFIQLAICFLIFAILVLLFVEKRDQRGCLKMFAAIFLAGFVIDVIMNFVQWLVK